jgi:hypothetical protein
MMTLKIYVILGSLLMAGAVNAGARESLFPRVKGWNVSVESRVYDANDLWDIIDGAADLYLEYSFVDLHIARYTTESSREVKVEIYRHRDGENAFGIYSAERSPEYNFIPIGSQGYRQTSVLNFVGGEFYIKLSSYQSDLASGDDLLTIAKEMEKHLKMDASLPNALQFFPLEGKQLNGEQFIAQNFLGYGFLRAVYTALYGGSPSFKAFIMEKKSRADADSTLKEYVSKMSKENSTALGGDRFDIRDPNNGPVSIAIEGAYIYGSLNCTDEKTNKELMAGLKKNIMARGINGP